MKINFNLILLTVLTLFSCIECVAEESQGTPDKKFYILPSSLQRNTNFKLVLPLPHPKNFAVKNPQGDWIYIIQDRQSDIKALADFANRNLFTLNTSDLVGVQFVDGKSEKKNVFLTKGRYLFYFADNLETEPENTFSLMISVDYKD